MRWKHSLTAWLKYCVSDQVLHHETITIPLASNSNSNFVKDPLPKTKMVRMTGRKVAMKSHHLFVVVTVNVCEQENTGQQANVFISRCLFRITYFSCFFPLLHKGMNSSAILCFFDECGVLFYWIALNCEVFLLYFSTRRTQWWTSHFTESVNLSLATANKKQFLLKILYRLYRYVSCLLYSSGWCASGRVVTGDVFSPTDGSDVEGADDL